MADLSYREREIIRLRYGLADGYAYTLEEVGKIFSVTRERVRQIESKAVRKLQQPYRARALVGFLDGVTDGPDRSQLRRPPPPSPVRFSPSLLPPACHLSRLSPPTAQGQVARSFLSRVSRDTRVR